MSDDDEVVGRVEIVLSQYDVCCYALVVSITAISLSAPASRNERLRLFSQALDEFEAGLFDRALQRAKAAAAPDLAASAEALEHDYETLRERLHRILAQRPGRA
ncbi:MAG TPA: hypothetical protein VIF14_15670 [Alphaproteobacteria bacterium]|jgi:hypothetical protein